MKKFRINLMEKDNPDLSISIDLSFNSDNTFDDFQMILKELLKHDFLKYELVSLYLIYKDE